MHTRRGFLRNTLGVCWTGAALLEQSIFRATQARAQSRQALQSLFDIQKIADGVYSAVAKPVTVLNCNAAIFENDKDLLVVDTHSKPSAVNALVAQLRREVTQKPVRYIVNSHFHWDHSQGGSAYKRISPHADVIASEATRKLLSEHGAARLKMSLQQMQSRLDEYRQKAGETKDPATKARFEREAADIRSYIGEMQNYTPELPNLTFSTDLILHDKAHDLHLAFRGRGHTAGDVVVFCPQKKAVATGDLLHGFLPFCGDGYPKEWPATLIAVGQMPFEQVAPGHGPVQKGKDRLRQEAAYLEELTAVIEKNRNKPVATIQDEITAGKLTSLRGGYREYLVANLGAANPNANGAELLSAGIRANIADIHRILNS